MIGQTLSHFRIIEKLGAGGMGVVYRAHDERLDRDVAVKVLPADSFRDPTARARLLREARTASKLNHPHICTIHEVGESEGQAFIAMELVEGQTLSALLAGGALPVGQVVRYGLHLADALAHAHERSVMHRDLKSANVVVTAEGRAKVLDFGLARRLSDEDLSDATTQTQDSTTLSGKIVGTLAYMAPEQLRGRPAEALKSIEMAPTFPLGYAFLADIYRDRGMYDEAIAAAQKAGELSRTWRWAIGPIYAAAGRREEARKLLAELNQQKPTPWGAIWRAQICTALGEMDEAFRWLDYEPHHAWIPWITVNPAYESLHRDPRFPELLRRMNLPPVNLRASGSR